MVLAVCTWCTFAQTDSGLWWNVLSASFLCDAVAHSNFSSCDASQHDLFCTNMKIFAFIAGNNGPTFYSNQLNSKLRRKYSKYVCKFAINALANFFKQELKTKLKFPWKWRVQKLWLKSYILFPQLYCLQFYVRSFPPVVIFLFKNYAEISQWIQMNYMIKFYLLFFNFTHD